MSKALASPAPSFDYRLVEKELKSKLLQLAHTIKKHTTGHLEQALEMGRHITAANELMAKAGKESLFGAWIKCECGVSRTTAYNYMNAYERFGDGNCSRLEQFTLESIYLLAADKTPDEAIQTAINLAEKGERITKDTATALKRRFSEHGRQRGTGKALGNEALGGDEPPGEAAGGAAASPDGDDGAGCPAPISGKPTFQRFLKCWNELIGLADGLKNEAPYHEIEGILDGIRVTYAACRRWHQHHKEKADG
jgi:hypothetical protein